MLLHPLQNTAEPGQQVQVRPRLTQGFAERPEVYRQFGTNGHNGADFGPNGNENIYAPFWGEVQVLDQGTAGYGLHIKIRDGGKECTLAHLSQVFVKTGDKVHLGDKIGLMGNTGFSTAKHLHFTLKFTKTEGPLWSRGILNPNNGFGGAVDPLPYLITWKGTQLNTTL